ncbi:MAG: ribosome-associated translation inhibitor RaiA [Bdellovibrionota bacterium]|mgnify:CR=1 FL=1|jgi:putative sigma-54 modulation protein|nr:ribosome-associated translation inhibitor RaiA [Bdellovibrionota bacterium]
MKVTISFQHLEHTPSLDDRIKEKTLRLGKYMEGKIHAKWNCYVEDHQHYAEIDLVGPKCEFHASAHADSMYKSIDLVLNKLEKQIQKKHSKRKNKMHRKDPRPEILDVESAWLDYDEDNFKDIA